jgi:cytochrome c-type biogenesis protein CcmF
LPVLAGLVVAAILFIYSGTRASPGSVIMFAAAAFVATVVGQELWRAAALRRAGTNEGPIVAVRGAVARNRRRYGGYMVHVGIAVLLVGVAASSAFQHITQLALTPGQSAKLDGYRIRYVRPTASVSAQKVDLGAVLDVRKSGHHVTTLTPAMGYYPIINAGLGPVGSYFDGNAESAIGLRAGLGRDIWTSVDPNLDSFQSMIGGIDHRFPEAGGQTQLLLLSIIAARYKAAPPPATFRFIVSPLVEWIWLGGLIGGAGAVLALWPATLVRREPRRRPLRLPAGIAAPQAGEPVPR